jgi:hypothetical protein
MGKKFILIDLRKRDEKHQIRELVDTLEKKMDQWIRNFAADETPPNEEECETLEADQINAILAEYDEEAEKLWRVKDEHAERRNKLVRKLNKRKGYLWGKFSGVVRALEDQAANTMLYCVSMVDEGIADLEAMFPMNEDILLAEFSKVKVSCEAYIDSTFPDGVAGLESYDSDFPEGVPSYTEFKDMLTEKVEALAAANLEAVEPAIEKMKEESLAKVKAAINEAIKQSLVEIEEDLSDDTLPYLGEERMAELRVELIAAAKEYGEGRLDVEEGEAEPEAEAEE